MSGAGLEELDAGTGLQPGPDGSDIPVIAFVARKPA